MSREIWASAFSGALSDKIRNLLLANTTGASSSWSTGDLWMAFLAQRGYTTGTLQDRMNAWLTAYTGMETGTIEDKWRAIVSPFTEGSDLIDVYTGAAAAFSTARRLRTSYSGPLMKVRRSTDNAEQDIGVDGLGALDTAALLAFASGGDAFMVVWYDQSINARHLDMATASRQPKVVTAGVVETMGGKPVAVYDGVNTRMSSTVNFALNSPMLMGYCAERHSIATPGIPWSYMSGDIGGNEMRVRAPGDAATTNMRVAVNGTSSSSAAGVLADTTYVSRARGRSDSTPTRGIRVNAGSESGGTPIGGTGFVNVIPIVVGGRNDNADFFNGRIGELVLYPDFTHQATNAIDNNMMTFWGA